MPESVVRILESLLGEIPRPRLEKPCRRPGAVASLAMTGTAFLEIERSAGCGVGIRERTFFVAGRGLSENEREDDCVDDCARAVTARGVELR
jgi:hypothetical protein